MSTPVAARCGSRRTSSACRTHFLDGARRAAEEIPNAELLLLAEADHYAVHVSPDEIVLEAALRVLRAS